MMRKVVKNVELQRWKLLAMNIDTEEMEEVGEFETDIKCDMKKARQIANKKFDSISNFILKKDTVISGTFELSFEEFMKHAIRREG